MGRDRLTEQLAEQCGATGISFIEGQRGADPNRVSSQHTGAGRGFEHLIVRADTRGLRGEPGERDRCTELLHLDLMFAAIAMSGQCAFETAQRGKRIRAGQTGAGPAARRFEEDDLCGLERIIGVAHRPAARRVGGAEGFLHQAPEILSPDGVTASEQVGQPGSDVEQAGGLGIFRLVGMRERKQGNRHGRTPDWIRTIAAQHSSSPLPPGLRPA